MGQWKMKMFRSKNSRVLPKVPTDYPTGLAVRADDEIFYIKGKTKYKFFNHRVFKTWALTPVEGTKESLSGHLYVGTLGFREGTLINNIADGKLYLVSGNKVRHIVSPDIFDKYGLDKNNVLEVSDEEVSLHEFGEVLN